MNEWVNEWVSEWMNEGIDKWESTALCPLLHAHYMHYLLLQRFVLDRCFFFEQNIAQCHYSVLYYLEPLLSSRLSHCCKRPHFILIIPVNVVFIPILEMRKVKNRVCTEIFCPNHLLFPPNEILSLQYLWFWNERNLNVSGTLSSFDFTFFCSCFSLVFISMILCVRYEERQRNKCVSVCLCV